MSVQNELNTIKDRVELLLKNFPETRDNDKLLWLAYAVIHKDLRSVFKNDGAYRVFKSWLLSSDVPMFESVRRVRQKFQEGGKYVGNARRERMLSENNVRTWARSKVEYV